MNDIKKFIEYSALSIGIELDPNGFGEDGSWCWMLDGNDVWQPLISEAQFMMLLSKLRLDIKHEPDLLSNGLGTVTVRPHRYSGIRSEESSVGKEWVGKCRSRWWRDS